MGDGGNKAKNMSKGRHPKGKHLTSRKCLHKITHGDYYIQHLMVLLPLIGSEFVDPWHLINQYTVHVTF